MFSPSTMGSFELVVVVVDILASQSLGSAEWTESKMKKEGAIE